jgi:metal-responsive CopG/Arc/MetJ family transcriptional regulator
VPILVRIQPQLLAGLDVWISQQNGSLTRPEAIRQLIEFALKAKQKNQSADDK